MTSTFSLNNDNDIYIGINGNLSISRNIEAIKFICQNVASARLGEMIYQENEGMPFLQSVFVGVPNIERYRSTLRKSLLNVSGVKRVLNIIINISSNILTYEATILTDNNESGILNGSTTI